MDSPNGQAAERVVLDDSGPRISVEIFKPERSRSDLLTVLVHGRNGKADAPHMLPVAQAYNAADITVVSVDAANSQWNDSAGSAADFTMGQHVEDARRTITWAQANAQRLGWSGQRLALAGHSMGGYAVCYLAATAFNNRISHVLAVAPVVSGQRQIEVKARTPNGLESLRREVPQALDEWPKHDIAPYIDKLTMPVAVIVGQCDTVTLADDVAAFYRRLPNPAGLTIIDDGQHCLCEPAFDAALRQHINARLARLT